MTQQLVETPLPTDLAGEMLDAADRRILSIIQSGFPVEPRPYQIIGEAVDLTEAEVLARVRAMKARKLIRRMGANFNSKGLGWRSTLCAAKVPADKMDAFVAEVNSYPGVTHNYLRDHAFNIWFTYIGPNWDAVCEALSDITAKTGVKILNLPATRVYKIKVDFNLED